MLSKEFLNKSAASLLPFIKAAAKGLRVKEEPRPQEIKWAWEHLKCAHLMFICPVAGASWGQFAGFIYLLSLSDGSGNGVDYNTSPRRPVQVDMADDEIREWFHSHATQELLALCEKRAEAWRALRAFENGGKIFLGEYRNVPVFLVQDSAWRVDSFWDTRTEHLLEMARLYIDAAMSLLPGFSATGFDAGYGENNIPYLLEEVAEVGLAGLYRILAPFSGESSEIKEAREVASMRALVEPKETSFSVTPEVQRLLDFARAKVG